MARRFRVDSRSDASKPSRMAALPARMAEQDEMASCMRALSSPGDPFEEAQSELVPAQEPQRGLPIGATSECWDYA